jgi:pyrroline-5-carboxylate reductase
MTASSTPGAAPLAGQRIGFVGGGRMAEALIRGLLGARVVAPDQVVVSDPLERRRRELEDQYAVRTTAHNPEAAAGAAVVLLAVKPQHLSVAMDELRGRIGSDALVLSIVAGVRIEQLSAGLQHARVVRAMPNTPAMVAAGATVWTASPEVTAPQRQQARAILSATGLEVAAPGEEYVEMATGFTAPAPAFVFLFVEALVEAGVALGFSHDQAMVLTLQTIHGSIELLRSTGEHPAVLRAHVTSPGGATAAGLHELERAGVRAALSAAVHAVFRRARELGDHVRTGP